MGSPRPIRWLRQRLAALTSPLLAFSSQDARSIRNDVLAGLTIVVILGLVGGLVTGLFSLTDSEPSGLERVEGAPLVDEAELDPADPTVSTSSSTTSGGASGTIVLEHRLGDSARAELTASDVALLRVPVRETSGWLLIDVLCDRASLELATPLVIGAVSDIEQVWDPGTIDDCGNDALFRDVSPQTYEFTIRLADGVDRGGFVLRAHVIKPPNEQRHLDRLVLPQLPELLDVTISRTLRPGTIHAYPLPIETSTELALSPQCPLEQALTLRIIDSSGSALFERQYLPNDCDGDRLTPTLSALERYELQVFATDPEAEFTYGLNTLAVD